MNACVEASRGFWCAADFFVEAVAADLAGCDPRTAAAPTPSCCSVDVVSMFSSELCVRTKVSEDIARHWYEVFGVLVRGSLVVNRHHLARSGG